MTGVALEGVADLARELGRVARALGAPDGFQPEIERPRDRRYGDYASNCALVLAGRLGEPPRVLAERIVESMDLRAAGVSTIEIAGPGFLNFRLVDQRIWNRLTEVLRSTREYGRSAAATAERVNVEFVSANPTGPLHVAHGRGAALGDVIAALLEWTGHDVTREFYVNDLGEQIRRLAESIDARFLESIGQPAEIPEGGYHGDYVRDLAGQIAAETGAETLRELSGEERRSRFLEAGVARMRADQARDLEEFGVRMDLFRSERELSADRAVERLIERLEGSGFAYERDDAVWMRTSDFGDEEDRVLVKSDGAYTYFAPDIVYHLDKAERRFDRAIDIWGADHHGHERRMLAALEALGMPDFLEVVILQLVTVLRGDTVARMSKRAGRFVTLRHLVDETGPDVARYFFLMRRAEVHLNFDLDLALDTSEANPVYKIQYAHARMCSVFARAELDPATIEAMADGLEELETSAERDVAKALLRFPEIVAVAAAARAPYRLCGYLEEAAGLVNSWYHQGNLDPSLRILADVPARTGRLKLARAAQITLRNGLRILGISAPARLTREERDET